jgi:hypothetical protein
MGVGNPLADSAVPAGGVWLHIRHRLTLVSVALLVLVSFAFAGLTLTISRGWVEEDLRERAITFAREIAVTIGGRQELENAPLLQEQIHQIQDVRQNVLQLDILAFSEGGTKVVATSHLASRLPFTREEATRVAAGRVISRLVEIDQGRYWEVLAPITLQGVVEGAVAAKFSLDRADRLASRIRRWSFAMTAASVVLTGLLVSEAFVHAAMLHPGREQVGCHARGAGALNRDTRLRAPDAGTTRRVWRGCTARHAGTPHRGARGIAPRGTASPTPEAAVGALTCF